jgi:hypothetical protein
VRRKPDPFVVLCAVLCILCTVVTVLFVAPTVLDTSNRTDETARLSQENAARTREVAALARAIQDQRKDAIRSNCQAQNRRHRDTIRALDVLIARLPSGPRRARAKANRRGTVFLLNAIVPHQDCSALVAKAAPTPK